MVIVKFRVDNDIIGSNWQYSTCSATSGQIYITLEYSIDNKIRFFGVTMWKRVRGETLLSVMRNDVHPARACLSGPTRSLACGTRMNECHVRV